MNTKAARLRALLKSDSFIIAPAVHDALSAKIVQATGFASACTSGAVLSHTLLGVPDVGVLSVTENVDHCRRLARVMDIPLTADADAGYGNPLNVYYTVRQFEDAGLSGVNLEDQVTPRRWGALVATEVISPAEMVRKIEAACMARRDDDFVIIVRTDAFAAEGLSATLARVRDYVAAGADVILPMGLSHDTDISSVVSAAKDVPVSISLSTHPAVGSSGFGALIDRLSGLGVRRASLPQWLSSAAVKAMTDVCDHIMTFESNRRYNDPTFPIRHFASGDVLRDLLDAEGVELIEGRLLTR
ncbi:isocitrate lyase/PEP mutase family protein [Paraburkholderia hospita]|nr:isocitrate lyase/PEP mutase family protein [Paraburkholderia hospita]